MTYPIQWDLDSLLPHPETDEFRTQVETVKAELETLAKQSEELPEPSGDPNVVSAWRDFLKSRETTAMRMTSLDHFVGCHAAGDAGNKLFQRYEAQLASLAPLRETIATNLEFGLKHASDEDYAAFVNGDEWLQEIRFALDDARSNAVLRLPKEQELLAADLGVDGIHAWGRLYDRLSGELRVQVMEKGELVEKSVSQVQTDSSQRTVRENNFYASDKAWKTLEDTCADCLNHISGTRLSLYRRLGLQDHLDAPLRYNRLKRETLDTMWNTISARKSMLVSYLQRKAQLLGVDRLAWYDVAAPLPVGTGSNTELDWDTACQTVVETFHGFSPDFGEFAEMALRDGWIEAENRAGKRQGGFCTGFPTHKQSRIFMTFTNSADSMSTLAHELGHAYHSWVLKERPWMLRHYPMNLAETASTFAEAVLGEQRLERSENDTDRSLILDNMLSDAVAFLMNIHCRFLFEDAFHKERASGEVPADRLSELMLSAQKSAYSDALADDGWNPRFWVSKLHFYISGLPFYNFPYTFGYLLSLGIYALRDEIGDEFPERYRQLLIATGSQTTEDAVQSTFGYDLTAPDFWNKSLDIVENRVGLFLDAT
ncbi:M3 family oligoendopeptidase [Thalassoroseus pseudoceratinae]|uniref:M3 family oligoendopeptidase n=1 Tax=Thalassoroseus pseudoceratinae TaxID=2713176 RepID=UPI001422F983|nr:M3 family oligoendopeptidase [Thalassoroseus pseudoceratinae]